MTPRESFINALTGGPPSGRVPHFELVFFLTMEAFGRVHPIHRQYSQWGQMTEHERRLHIHDMAEVYVMTAREFEHSAIFYHHGLFDEEYDYRVLEEIRRLSGDDYFLMMHGDSTYAIPHGGDMMEFCGQLAEKPHEMKDQAARQVDEFLRRGERFRSTACWTAGRCARTTASTRARS